MGGSLSRQSLPYDFNHNQGVSTMKRKIRVAGVLALVAGTALLATGCSGSGGGNASSNGKVSMTFWHNATTGPGKAFWEKTVADFEKANPGVTIKIQAIQN